MVETRKETRRRKPHTDIQLIPVRGSIRPLAPGDLALVVCGRNGLRFLPSFLKHYRGLGVSRFLWVDDRSTDGSLEVLASERDVDVFTSNVRYKDASRSRIWREMLFAMHGKDRWYLNVDIDEYLIFEDCEQRDLHSLIAELEARRILRCAAPMIDAYPEGPLSAGSFNGADDSMPWQSAPMFDGHGYTLRKGKLGLKMEGGPRRRLFDSELELMKYPVIFWHERSSLASSIHRPSPYSENFVPILGVLLHFKFFDDIEASIATAISDGQYFDASREYRRLAELINAESVLSFAGSIRFRGSKDLVERGFITRKLAERGRCR